MVLPNYTYLKLKMLDPVGTITVGTTTWHAYECEVECCDLAEGAATNHELSEILRTVDEQAPDVKRMSTTLKLADVVNEVTLNREHANGWIVRVGSNLSQNRKVHSSTSST